MNPVFVIAGKVETDISPINYCAWNSRFYFVDDIIFLSEQQAELHCSVDVLATYRGNILSYKAFVVRADDAVNQWLPDPGMLPLENNAFWGYNNANMPSSWDPSEGCYLLRVVGGGGTSGTGITSYCVNAVGLNHIVEKAFSSANYDFLSDESIKSFFNPFQYIVSVMWFPLTPASLGSSDFKHIKLGWWDLGESYRVVDRTVLTLNTIIKRPSNLPDDFRARDSRFTTVKMHLPGCGTHFLNPIDVASDLQVDYHIDTATGGVQVAVHSSDRNQLIGTYSGIVGVPIAIGQLDTNMGQVVKSLASGLGAGLSGNVGGLLGGVGDAALSLAQPTPSVNGSNGNRGALQSMPYPAISWACKYSTPVADDIRGHYVCAARTLSTLRGYVQTLYASLDVKGTSGEKDKINAFLDGGVFIE